MRWSSDWPDRLRASSKARSHGAGLERASRRARAVEAVMMAGSGLRDGDIVACVDVSEETEPALPGLSGMHCDVGIVCEGASVVRWATGDVDDLVDGDRIRDFDLAAVRLPMQRTAARWYDRRYIAHQISRFAPVVS